MGLPHFVLLYVDEPQASAEFYARLLDRKPLDSSPNFVMFALSPDLRLGLWARRDVKPAPGSARRHRRTGDGGCNQRRGRSALRRSEAQRRRDLAGADDDGLRPDLRGRGPRRTSASGVLPCALRANSRPRVAEQIDRDVLGEPRSLSRSRRRLPPGAAQRRHNVRREATNLLPRSDIRSVARHRRIAETGECRPAWRGARCAQRRRRCRKFRGAARLPAPD